jgi:hypothetical protein
VTRLRFEISELKLEQDKSVKLRAEELTQLVPIYRESHTEKTQRFTE